MKKWIKFIIVPIGLIIFISALALFHNELKNLSYTDIINSLKAIPSTRVFVALCLALTYYLLLGGYDIVAFKYIDAKVPLKPKDILFTCFVSNVLGNNTGYSMLFGGSIRYRLYSFHNVSIVDVTKVLFFSSATIWLGLLAIGGLVFTFTPVSLAGITKFTFSTRPVGILFLIILSAYVLFSVFQSKPIKFFKWKISFPNIKIVIAQIILATGDWVVASLTLYMLMPAGEFPYFILIKVFLISQLLGIISQVPGGMGVFETAIVFLLPQAAENPAVMGGLLAYRAVFYFFPLSITLFMLASYEIVRMSKKIDEKMRIFGKTVSSVIVQILAVSTFLAAMIAMFSTSTPFGAAKLRAILNYVPMWLLDLSHFLLSTTAAALLFLSRGLQLRIKNSYIWTCFLMGLTMILLILTAQPAAVHAGFAVLFVALLFSKKYYYREVPLIDTAFNPWWFSAIGGVFVISVWIGFFVNRQDIFSWIHLEIFFDNMFSQNDAARFLRAAFGVGVVLVIVAVEQFVRSFFNKPVVFDMKDITNIVNTSDYSYAFNALSGDKKFVVNKDKGAFIMYAPIRNNWIALGDPVGDAKKKSELLWKFKELTDDEAVKPAFIGIDHKNMHIYEDIGLDVFNIGQEAKVPLRMLNRNEEVVKYFDKISLEVEAEGYVHEIISPQEFDKNRETYAAINEEWIKNSNYIKRNFIPGKYDEQYMKKMNFGIIKKDGKMCAFSVIAASKSGYEASSGVVRHTGCEEKVFEYILFKNMLWAKSNGYKWFDLGLTYVPNSDNDNDIIKRFAKMFTFAEHFDYDLAKLKEFKNKFYPIWHNKYIALRPDKYIMMFVRNFTALIAPPKEKSKKLFFKRLFIK
ncbi:MAG: phosphatidylglycerol lysyltransferase domain-containing protein [Endomicrobium sp.]|jgi:phosphatidylglycerol lysyltransferase|nr:phosphatidylglycerol lysyltransferase domain-containing protein [Endomicrobium sp.]